MAAKFDMKYFETSALTDTNVKEMIQSVIEEVFVKVKKPIIDE